MTAIATAPPARRSLFDIGEDLIALDALLDECEGNVTDPAVCAAWEAMAAELEHDESRKLDGLANFIRQAEMEEAAARVEAETYLAKARTRANRVLWIKGNLKLHLEATGRTKIETATKRVFSLQANGGIQKLSFADSTTPESIPTTFQKVKVEYNTEVIREALKDGTLSFAWLEPRGTSLRIR